MRTYDIEEKINLLKENIKSDRFTIEAKRDFEKERDEFSNMLNTQVKNIANLIESFLNSQFDAFHSIFNSLPEDIRSDYLLDFLPTLEYVNLESNENLGEILHVIVKQSNFCERLRLTL